MAYSSIWPRLNRLIIKKRCSWKAEQIPPSRSIIRADALEGKAARLPCIDRYPPNEYNRIAWSRDCASTHLIQGQKKCREGHACHAKKPGSCEKHPRLFLFWCARSVSRMAFIQAFNAAFWIQNGQVWGWFLDSFQMRQRVFLTWWSLGNWQSDWARTIKTEWTMVSKCSR